MNVFSCSVIQSRETPWNCSQEGPWIILSNWVMISGQKCGFFFPVFQMYFLAYRSHDARRMIMKTHLHVLPCTRDRHSLKHKAGEEDVRCALAKPRGNPLLRQRLTDLTASKAQKQAKRQRLNPVTSRLTDWWGGKCSFIQRADSNTGHSPMANQ